MATLDTQHAQKREKGSSCFIIIIQKKKDYGVRV